MQVEGSKGLAGNETKVKKTSNGTTYLSAGTSSNSSSSSSTKKSSSSTKKSSSSSSKKSSSGGTTSKSQETDTAGSNYDYSSENSASSGYGVDYSSIYNNYLNQLRSQAEGIYNQNMDRISSAYDSGLQNIENTYNSSKATLDSSNSANQRSVNTDAETSMRQAYINNMLNRKNLQQDMSAQGLNGGASESTMASLANNYGNSRNNIDTQRESSLSDLLQQYQSNLSSLLSNYSSQKNDMYNNRIAQEMSAASQLQNLGMNLLSNSSLSSLSGTDSSYLSAMSALANGLNSFSYDPTAATNDFNATNTNQASSNVSSNYGKILAKASQAIASGQSGDAVKNIVYSALQNSKLSASETANLLSSLGITV